MLLRGPPRPDDRRRGHEDAVERPGDGPGGGEPDMVLDGDVEVKVAAEERRSVVFVFKFLNMGKAKKEEIVRIETIRRIKKEKKIRFKN